jgi:hypothetical protein
MIHIERKSLYKWSVFCPGTIGEYSNLLGIVFGYCCCSVILEENFEPFKILLLRRYFNGNFKNRRL